MLRYIDNSPNTEKSRRPTFCIWYLLIILKKGWDFSVLEGYP